MNETLKQSLLAYLETAPNRYQPFTAIFENCHRSEAWKSSYSIDTDPEGDEKNAFRMVLIEMVFDALIIDKRDVGDFEDHYALTDRALYEEDPEIIVDPDNLTPPIPVHVDSAAWTGLSQTCIDSRNAVVISKLIDKALGSLPSAHAGNFEVMQASAYLKAAKELVNAPEPPSLIIWQLISKAADIVGLIGLFYTIFCAAR